MAALAIMLVLAAALAAAVYLVSLRLRPWWPCGSCGATGRTRSRLGRASGTCPKCGGKGKRPRLGIRVLQRDRARDMLPARGAHKKADRRT